MYEPMSVQTLSTGGSFFLFYGRLCGKQPWLGWWLVVVSRIERPSTMSLVHALRWIDYGQQWALVKLMKLTKSINVEMCIYIYKNIELMHLYMFYIYTFLHFRSFTAGSMAD
jgi:hypothetical protein